MSQRLTLLGSTGSIGLNTLDVVRRLDGRYSVHALVAGRNVDRLVEQIREFQPAVAVVDTPAALSQLKRKLEESGLDRSRWPELAHGPAARVAAATAEEVDFVLSAIVGVAGLEATYEAVRAGKRIGLANKEVLVAGGPLVVKEARGRAVELIPVDSEHNGVHQCLRTGKREEAVRLILTASGGPFRRTPLHTLADVTPRQALNHPTWKMGPRITIDSATMMNKGFEVIEACWLFDFAPDEVDVVIHPSSSVHAMVEFNDGSVMAQISTTDMRMPIQYALTWPDRLEAPVPRMDWSEPRVLEFYPPDLERFPLLRLAYEAQRAGGSAACALNAADEVAVQAFLEERIGFLGISEVVEETLSRADIRAPESIADVIEIDRAAREAARGIVQQQRVTARPMGVSLQAPAEKGI